MTNVLVHSLKMHMKHVLYNKFRMIIFHDQEALTVNFKSSCLQMFFKIDVLKNVHRKRHVQELLFNIVSGLEDSNFMKKRFQHKYFLVNIAKFLRTPILKSICEWLLLYF